MKNVALFALALFLCFPITGCVSPDAQKDIQAVQDPDGQKLTTGTVQREIRVGMSGADVTAALGSPNIITTDDQRREVWVYDKVSTQQAYSQRSSGGLALFLFGGGGSGARSSVQKTLTIIIKFDKDKKVRDFSYHTSQF